MRAAAEAGARLVIVDRGPTPYDDRDTEVIRAPIGTSVPRLAGALRAALSTRRQAGRAAVHRILRQDGTVIQNEQAAALDGLEPGQIALVLVDFQNDFCRPAEPGHDPAQTE